MTGNVGKHVLAIIVGTPVCAPACKLPPELAAGVHAKGSPV